MTLSVIGWRIVIVQPSALPRSCAERRASITATRPTFSSGVARMTSDNVHVCLLRIAGRSPDCVEDGNRDAERFGDQQVVHRFSSISVGAETGMISPTMKCRTRAHISGSRLAAVKWRSGVPPPGRCASSSESPRLVTVFHRLPRPFLEAAEREKTHE